MPNIHVRSQQVSFMLSFWFLPGMSLYAPSFHEGKDLRKKTVWSFSRGHKEVALGSEGCAQRFSRRYGCEATAAEFGQAA